MSQASMKIRVATVEDSHALLQIYSPIVQNTAISFELTPPTEAEFGQRIASCLAEYDWLVAEAEGELCGYAYATAHRPREAYQHSVETSVYVRENHRGNGVGRLLYTELFRRLENSRFHRAFAGISLPNEGSVALHQRVGFEAVGVFREVGYKQGAWHDVSWWQRAL